MDFYRGNFGGWRGWGVKGGRKGLGWCGGKIKYFGIRLAPKILCK